MEITVKRFLARYYDDKQDTFDKMKELDLYDYVAHELLYYKNNRHSIEMTSEQYEYFVNNKMRLNFPDAVKLLDALVLSNKSGDIASAPVTTDVSPAPAAKPKAARKKKTK